MKFPARKNPAIIRPDIPFEVIDKKVMVNGREEDFPVKVYKSTMVYKSTIGYGQRCFSVCANSMYFSDAVMVPKRKVI